MRYADVTILHCYTFCPSWRSGPPQRSRRPRRPRRPRRSRPSPTHSTQAVQRILHTNNGIATSPFHSVPFPPLPPSYSVSFSVLPSPSQSKPHHRPSPSPPTTLTITALSLQALVRKALARWPPDPLRPTAQLGTVLAARLPTAPPAQQNAALGLLANKFSARYALRADQSLTGSGSGGGIMAPRSNPGYYQALMRDLDELPDRTWAQRLALRLKGMVRWS